MNKKESVRQIASCKGAFINYGREGAGRELRGHETKNNNFHFSPDINLILNITTFQALICLTDYLLLALRSIKYGLDSYDSHKAGINRVMKEKIDSIPVILRELLQEISTTDKTLLQRNNCIALKERRTQLKEIIKEIRNNKISKEIKLFFLPCSKSQFLEWAYMLVLVSQCQIIM